MVYQISTGRDGTERRFLYVSQSHEKLTGVPAEGVLADPSIPYRLIGSAAQPRLGRAGGAAGAGLADPSIPYRLIVSEDQPRLVEAESAALRDGTPLDVQVRFR